MIRNYFFEKIDMLTAFLIGPFNYILYIGCFLVKFSIVYVLLKTHYTSF